MIEINLIPDIKKEFIRAQRTRTAVISIAVLAVIIAVGISVVLVLYVFVAQALLLGHSDNRIKDESNKLAQVEDLSKILTVQNQVKQVGQTHANKSITSRLFNVLDGINPPYPNDITISSVKLDTQAHTLTIQAQAEGAYRALETYQKTLTAARLNYVRDGKSTTVPLVPDTSDTGLSFTDIGYGDSSDGRKILSFKLTMTYTEELFDPALSNITISIEGTDAKPKDVTDSANGVPESLFKEKTNTSKEGE